MTVSTTIPFSLSLPFPVLLSGTYDEYPDHTTLRSRKRTLTPTAQAGPRAVARSQCTQLFPYARCKYCETYVFQQVVSQVRDAAINKQDWRGCGAEVAGSAPRTGPAAPFTSAIYIRDKLLYTLGWTAATVEKF
ncbi:hypothetical protein EVAR_83403_1 [Eumeta japonica]|uniref:Uncharacterized protein n=1 Tax=Eumeta variegata TaxID=151549 RepID=A0A4C1TYL1_EUMVA|nr:hypothetical protein EVAR_83403_1 [Eumeta japonica]